MKIIKKIEAEIKNKKNECWEYHKDILKESNYCKSDIGSVYIDAHELEDVMFFEGVIYGLNLAKEMWERGCDKRQNKVYS